MALLTAPSKDVFDPAKGYVRVRAIGDRDYQDFEAIETQQIVDEQRKRLFDKVFAEGAIIAESGGTISAASQGVKSGDVQAISSGAYLGFQTQIYTLVVTTAGGSGVAVIHVSSDGDDNGVEGRGFDIEIASNDPLDGTVDYAVGTQGISVAFDDPKGVHNLVAADSWTILATYNRQLPTVNAQASTITPTTIALYLDGRIVIVPSATLTYPSKTSGVDTIYVEVLRDIITGDNDTSLKAYKTGLNSAERERVTGTFKNHDTSSDVLPPTALSRTVVATYLWNRATDQVEVATRRPLVLRLDDMPGQLPANSLAHLDFAQELKGILAEIVDDITGGSFRISGLKSRLSTNVPPTGKALVSVGPGKARISGLSINRFAQEEIEIDLATDTALVLDEAKTYSTGTNVYALNKAIGANQLPIKDVVQLTAIVEVTDSITKGTANGLDALPHTPVSSIISVDMDATHYDVTDDYVQNGNFIDWSPGGDEPGSGQSYTVQYRYTKQMVLTTDYLLIDDDGDGDLDSIDFSPGGDNPVNSSTFFVDYDYYLKRIDLIVLNPAGQLSVVKGTPADFPVAPKGSTESLNLAQISVGPNSQTDVVVQNLRNYRITMADMRDAIARQEDQRFNDAQFDLLTQAKLNALVELKGVFADAFAFDTIADHAFDRPGGLGGYQPGTQVTYDALIDLTNLELSLTPIIETVNLVQNDTLVPVSQTATKLSRDFATLPYTEVLEIDQDQWSEERNINPFNVFDGPQTPPPGVTPLPNPTPCEIRLVPDKDIGVNEVTTKVDQSFVTMYTHEANIQGIVLAQGSNIQNMADSIEFARREGNVHAGSIYLSSEVRSNVQQGVSDAEVIDGFMREIPVKIFGARFQPDTDNITCLFGGKLVALSPIAPTVAGTQAGTVKANSDGTWNASFTIPAQVPLGQATVMAGLFDVPAPGAMQGIDYAVTSFDGRLMTRTTWLIDIVYHYFTDPLAQTFAFSEPTTLVRVQVPFARKGEGSEGSVEAQIRDVAMPGGFPGLSVFSSNIRNCADINVGANSINSFAFPNPIYQTANDYRALVLITLSSKYFVYSATLGSTGRNPAQTITTNPNLRSSEPAGILLESLNALNWEARSVTALRYKLYRAEFAPEAWIYFDRIGSVEYSQLFLSADQVVPDGTAIQWQVSIDGLDIGNAQKEWKNIEVLTRTDLGLIATTVDVRVKLSTTNARVSPYINFNNWHLKGLLYKTAGKYVSVATDITQDIAAVTIYVQTQVPSVCTQLFYVSNAEDSNGDTIWEAVTTVESQSDMGNGFMAKALTLTLDNANVNKVQKTRFRTRVDMTTSDQSKTPKARALAVTMV